MKIRSQVGMVLNLDKCIGCHTCSVTCKNVWTSREGMEYAWFNNVETKPGIGYPKNWEDQEEWQGGWIRGITASYAASGRQNGRLSKIFANPVLPGSTITTNPLPLITSICTTRRRENTCPPPARAR
jgi:nitrate reductase beta subunit